MNFHKIDIMTVLVLVVALGLVVTLSAQARIAKEEGASKVVAVTSDSLTVLDPRR
jgi:hypothetical protein